MYKVKRKELSEKLEASTFACFVQQVANMHKKGIQSFLEDVKVGVFVYG